MITKETKMEDKKVFFSEDLLVVKFGIFTDIHYSKSPDYGNRYLQFSKYKLEQALIELKKQKTDFSVCLGDVIDKPDNESGCIENLKEIIQLCKDHYHRQVYFLPGNHDLENMTKEEFIEVCKIPSVTADYSFTYNGIHFVIIDCNFGKDGLPYRMGNKHWTDSYVPEAVLNRLNDTLKTNQDKVTIIFSHHCLDYRLSDGEIDVHCPVNSQDVRDIINKYDNVKAVFCGHYHNGYYQKDKNTHYINAKALVTGNTPDNTAFMAVSVYNNGFLKIAGYGRETNMLLD